MEGILPRNLVNTPDEEGAIFSTAFTLKLVGGAVGFLLNIVLFVWFKKPDSDLLLMMSLMASLLIFQAADVSDIFFKAKMQSKYSVIGRNIAFIIVALLKIYFVYNHYSLAFFVATNSLEMLLGGIFVFSIYFKKKNKLSLSLFSKKIAKGLLKDSIPIALSGLMIILYMRIDQVMLTEMAGDAANGIYSTGVRMIEIVYFIPIALADSFFPGIVYSKKHEGEKYNKNLLGFYSIMTYSGILIGIGTVIIAIPMMRLFFGLEYEGSGEVLQVMGMSVYAVFIGIASGKYLVTENYKNIILLRSLIGLLINIALNFLWIPKFGFMGAAYASLFSYFVPIIILFFFNKTRGQVVLILKAFHPKYLLEKMGR